MAIETEMDMAANQLSASTDLSALFGINVEQAEQSADVAIDKIICAKCHGKGTFIGWTGKAIGKCFACDGSGIERNVAVEIKHGDCVKCAGSGEWRAGRSCFACNGTGREVQAATINVGAIEVAFQAARANSIKNPKLRLGDFLFSRAPDHGKNAGSIYVKRSEEYLGKIAAGLFQATGACDATTKAKVIEVAADPHNAAKAYGLRTGSCSCCGRALTNGESIDIGIGPICREKFGW